MKLPKRKIDPPTPLARFGGRCLLNKKGASNISEVLIIISIMFIAVSGPSVVIAVLGYSVIKALSRNPSAANKIFIGMVVLLVFVEAISIMAILIIFQLFGR